MNILIVGDSFSADWSSKFNQYAGWPNLLAQKNWVINLSQAGCSEYRILQQLQSVKNIDIFDCVIVSHTSPSRIFTTKHPLHHSDSLHHHCDLIFTDIDYHYKRPRYWFNRALSSARNFFIYHYDQEYYQYLYSKIRQDIDLLTETVPLLSLSFFECLTDLGYTHDLNFSNLLIESPGLINHFSESANNFIFQQVNQVIQNKVLNITTN
jgi:hypothetical protein